MLVALKNCYLARNFRRSRGLPRSAKRATKKALSNRLFIAFRDEEGTTKLWRKDHIYGTNSRLAGCRRSTD